MRIDLERKRKYESKLSFITEKIENLPPYNENNDLIHYRIYFIEALFYRLQTAIEAIMDVIAMLCKDNNIKVEDDYNNIEHLIKGGILPLELGEGLRKLNGLRNALVHKYNRIEEKIILESLDDIIGVIIEFVEFTEEVING